MKNRIVRILVGITAASMALTGCSSISEMFSSTDSSEGRTSLIADTEEDEDVEEMEAAVEFDKWYTDDQPGVPQNVNVDDYLTTAVDVSNLTVSESELVPSDEELATVEQELLEAYSTESDDTSLTAKTGDRVTVSYEGTVDGQTLSGYTATSAAFKIGSNSMSEQFEKKLVGMHPGDTKNITVTYDDDYSDEDVAGKTVIFSVTMENIYVLDELTDDWISEHTDYSTIDEYEKAYKAQYKSTALYQEAYNLIGELADTIEEYPEEYLGAYKNLLQGFDELSYENAVELNDMGDDSYTFEEYMESVYGEDYDTILDSHAKTYVAQQLACLKVGTALGLDFTSDDYEEYITNNSVSNSTIQRYGKGYISSVTYEQYVLQQLMDRITITKS